MFAQILFFVLSIVAVVAGLIVISVKNPITSAIALVVSLASMAGLFAMLDAHFIATLQVLVYAGAIMVLFVFVIMLLNLHPSELTAPRLNGWKVLGILSAMGVLALFLPRLAEQRGPPASIEAGFGTIEGIGMQLFSDYLVPFELISVLLTAAVVGAVIVAKREI